jgi:amino acid adenylation domain-containing protein
VFSRKEQSTLFVTLLAAFKVLLYRYTGQDDVVVGTPVANRDRAETEGLIGCFVNMLALRTDLRRNPSFQELLGRVRETTMGAYAHRDLPFEMLVQELQPKRDLSRTPLFQVVFVLQGASTEALELPGLTLTLLKVGGKTAKFDLTLVMAEMAGELKGELEYNTDLFDADTIKRLVDQLQFLLEGIATTPGSLDQRIADVPILPQPERQRLLVQWNETQISYPQDHCIHQLFEAQAEQMPDAVAVVFQDRHLTYGKLNRRANQLAHRLRRLGVGPEMRVAVCMERCPEVVIGLLGALKAGGAYVPLDPVYPRERLDFMLADFQPAVLLTQGRLVEKFAGYEVYLVCLDAGGETFAQESEVNPISGVATGNLAYVIYTSGSTGVPKGVAVEHHSVLALLYAFEHIAPPTQDLTATAVCSFGFDVSVWEFFSTLCFGGTLHILLPETFADAQRFARYLVGRHVTSAYLPPALLPGVASALEKQERKIPLQRLLVGVEPIKQGLLQRFRNLAAQMHIVNGYGPTETTICATFFDFKSARDPEQRTPIGTAAPGYKVYVVDQKLQPVPIGVSGEILIGGAGLGRGYLGRAALSAEKFIPDPFPPPSIPPSGGETRRVGGGARLYRTGDLARYLPDGKIEFLGRIDHQVKIRGYRIELGEIETVLAQHPAVREAVALAREDGRGDKRLVAYVVPNDGQQLTVSELYRFLRTRLPDYMLPSAFVTLETLPLTPNGKVSRRALPAPEQYRPELEAAFVAPRTPAEEMLAGVWAEVLGIERVGAHDNFFELGGQSLLATQVTLRLGQLFGQSLSVRALFETPTVAALATHIETLARAGQGRQVPPIQPVSRHKPLPLSFAQQQLWLVDRLDPGNVAYNVSFPLRLNGPLDVAALRKGLTELVRRHEALRTTFPVVDRLPVQVIAPASAVPLCLVNLSQMSQAERERQACRLARGQARRPFDLDKGPLFRATLLQLEQTEHWLLLAMHHIVVDGWSTGILLAELGALYAAFVKGQGSSLPELPVQYADFACWQREQLPGEVFETQLAYWKEKLWDAPVVLKLSTDRPRPPVQTFHGTRRAFVLPESLRQGLKALSRQEHVTLFMTLLAAFKVLLYGYTGQKDIVVGTPVANRSRPEVEGLIGFFVNSLALCTRLADDLTFLELLGRVRETALGAYAHQDLPFERLIDALHPRRDKSYNPLFQVLFVLQNTPAAITVQDLSLSPLKLDAGTAQFDLSLEMEDGERGLAGFMEYNTDLFDDATIARMLEHYQTLLENIKADPGRRISALLLSIEQYRSGEATPELARDSVSPRATRGDAVRRRARHAARKAELSAALQAQLEQRLRGD